jgi:hypothetical protein
LCLALGQPLRAVSTSQLSAVYVVYVIRGYACLCRKRLIRALSPAPALAFKAAKVVQQHSHACEHSIYTQASSVHASRPHTSTCIDHLLFGSDTAPQRDHAWHEASAWYVVKTLEVVTCNAQHTPLPSPAHRHS